VDPFLALLERGAINERQYQGLVYAREHGAIVRREYVQLTGAPERTATRDLTDLVEMDLLERVGRRGWTSVYRPRERHA
jgi:Fic family protein